jgi:hypothetical protein
VENEAIEQELARAGWEMDYGFSGHLIIGNAGDLSILAPPQAWWSATPEYELYDVQRNIACRVGVIPTPIRAEILLEEHGAEAFEDELEWATSSTTNYY